MGFITTSSTIYSTSGVRWLWDCPIRISINSLLFGLGFFRGIFFSIIFGASIGAIAFLSHFIYLDYSIEYYDGTYWQSFASETSNEETTTFHQLSSYVLAEAVRITITSTIGTDQNKRMKQFICTRKFESGQLNSWPIIKPSLDENKKVNEMLSGKVALSRSVGGYNIRMSVEILEDTDDLELIQSLYFRKREGVLCWFNAGNSTQFTKDINFWSKEDIFLCLPVDNWRPEWKNGFYKSGQSVSNTVSRT